MIPLILAQSDDFFRDRTSGVSQCVRDDGVCPRWIADNFDRYVDAVR